MYLYYRSYNYYTHYTTSGQPSISCFCNNGRGVIECADVAKAWDSSVVDNGNDESPARTTDFYGCIEILRSKY